MPRGSYTVRGQSDQCHRRFAFKHDGLCVSCQGTIDRGTEPSSTRYQSWGHQSIIVQRSVWRIAACDIGYRHIAGS